MIETDEIDLVVEARDDRHALVVALQCYAGMNSVDQWLMHWDTDYPPDVEDLGPVPQDVLMRRDGQPELPLGVYA